MQCQDHEQFLTTNNCTYGLSSDPPPCNPANRTPPDCDQPLKALGLLELWKQNLIFTNGEAHPAIGADACSTTTRRPLSTMECSQPASWTSNRSLLVASRVKTFSKKTDKSGSTIPRAAHLKDGSFFCYRHCKACPTPPTNASSGRGHKN